MPIPLFVKVCKMGEDTRFMACDICHNRTECSEFKQGGRCRIEANLYEKIWKDVHEKYDFDSALDDVILDSLVMLIIKHRRFYSYLGSQRVAEAMQNIEYSDKLDSHLFNTIDMLCLTKEKRLKAYRKPPKPVSFGPQPMKHSEVLERETEELKKAKILLEKAVPEQPKEQSAKSIEPLEKTPDKAIPEKVEKITPERKVEEKVEPKEEPKIEAKDIKVESKVEKVAEESKKEEVATTESVAESSKDGKKITIRPAGRGDKKKKDQEVQKEEPKEVPKEEPKGKMIKCPSCGKEMVDENFADCPFCGEEFKPAEKTVVKSHKTDPKIREELEKLKRLGNDAYNDEEYDKAIEYYNQAIALDPTYDKAWYNKGDALRAVGDFEGAIECYDKALDLNPNQPGAWANKGVALGGLKRYDEAIKCCDKALRINPEYTAAWFNKGVALGCVDAYDEAIQCYNKALELNPEYTPAWFNKGVMLDAKGDHEGAIKCYDMVLQIDPENTSALVNKGVSLEKMNKNDEAIKCYETALEIDPDHESARKNLDMLLDKMNAQLK